jgi:hypothetical protein
MKIEGEIDPVKYGVMWQKVQSMEKTINKMECQMEELLELANKSKGGMFAGMAIVSFIGGIAGFIAHWFTMK